MRNEYELIIMDSKYCLTTLTRVKIRLHSTLKCHHRYNNYL